MKSASTRRRDAGFAGLLTAVAVAVLAPAVAAQDLETAVQESYATNLVLLREATKASVAELFIGFTAPAGETLLVEPDGDHPANWYVENHLLAHLTQAGYQAYLKEPSRPPANPTQAANANRPRPGGRGMQQAQEETGQAGSLADAMKAADSTMAATPEPESKPPDRPEAGAATPEARHADYVLRYRVVHFEISYPKNYRTSPLGSRKVQRRVSVSIQANLLRGAREDVVWVGDGAVERLDVVPASKLALLEGSDFPFTQPTLQTRGLGSLVEPALVSGIVVGLIYLFYTNQD